MQFDAQQELICTFVVETLPMLRARFGTTVTLRIAGSAPAPEVTALAAFPGVEIVANPADLTRHYRWADLAVIPLTAGGGTRIKLASANLGDDLKGEAWDIGHCMPIRLAPNGTRCCVPIIRLPWGTSLA